MNVRYTHTQTGTLLRLSAVLPVPLALAAAVLAGSAVVVGVCALLAVVLVPLGLAVSSLTIEVDDQALRWSFGWGLWRKQIALSDIASARTARNPWWYGFGIHLTPRGWLYNVGGLDAVEIALRNGRTLRLGTDEPERLSAALAAAIG